MLRKILVVDDSAVNRQILRKTLSNDYEVIEAQNGEEALAILGDRHSDISAVLLDLIMPVMDGFHMLEEMRKRPELAQIPAIVTTGSTERGAEAKALALGAHDYITKPYDPTIVRHRIRNTINLRETSATVNALQRDRLTGLYNREAFFERAAVMIRSRAPGHYVMTCFDIDNFKVINDQYGTAEGDRVLKLIADTFRKGFEPIGGMLCRVMADNFAILYPRQYMGTGAVDEIRRAVAALPNVPVNIGFSIGRYIVDDLSLPVSAMYDRAAMAEVSIKGRFDANIALYDESMRERLLREQEIVNEMKTALAGAQFEVWLQPQYNHSSGLLAGAEALVRWRHPVKGLIPPGVFIQVFERNGFIYELDKYVWEQTCALLRRWLDEGRQALPVSVNISRYDMFRDDLIDVITGLVGKYGIPADLLRFEVTESAFAKSTEHIVGVAKRLIDSGFTLEIDDFGSGYSSLNTLKDVPASVLKLDMRFLEDKSNSQRGGNILESVVRMAKWLGMSVIAEGVETRVQADFLMSIGCNYVQGYLYAKPMPVSDYEALERSVGADTIRPALETVEKLDNNSFWDPKSMDTLIFNSYVGAACIFELSGRKSPSEAEFEVLRANRKYATVLGGADFTVGEALRLKFKEHVDESYCARMSEAFRRAIETGEEVVCEVAFSRPLESGRMTHIHAAMRVIARTNDRYLFYCTIDDVTAQHEAERRAAESSERMTAIMENVNGGVSAVTLGDGNLTDEGAVVHIAFANDRYYSILGYTREQFVTEVANPFELVLPEDRPRISAEIAIILSESGSGEYEYRCRKRDGEIVFLRCDASVTGIRGIGEQVLLSVISDITEFVNAEREVIETSDKLRAITENVNGGVSAVTIRNDNNVDFVFANDQYYSQLGYTRAQFEAEVADPFELVHPDDREVVMDTARNARAVGERFSVVYRAVRRDGEVVWLQSNISIIPFAGAAGPMQISVANDVTEQQREERKWRNASTQLRIILQNTTSGVSALTLTDDRAECLFANDECYAMFGYTKEQFESELPRGIIDLIYPEDMQAVRAVAAETEKSSKSLKVEFRARKRDGSLIRVRGNSSTCTIDGVSAPVHISVINDVTHEKCVEQTRSGARCDDLSVTGTFSEMYGPGCGSGACSAAFEEFKLLTDNVPGGLASFRITPDELHIIYFNEEFYRYSGYSRDEFAEKLSANPMLFIFEEDLPAVSASLAALRDGSSTVEECSYRGHTPDGGRRWFRLKAKVVEVNGDEKIANAVQFDITENKNAEEKLRTGEERFRIAAALGDRTVARYDIKTGTYYNDSELLFSQGFGKEIQNVPDAFIEAGAVAPECEGEFRRLYGRLQNGEKNSGATVALRVADGSFRWFRMEGTLLPSENGAPREAIIMFYDTTEQREKEAIYQKWQQSLSEKPKDSYTLFRCNLSKGTSFDAVDGSLLKIVFHPAAKTFNARTLEYAEQFVHPDDREEYIALLDSDVLLADYYRGRRAVTMEYRERLPDGHIRWLRLSIELVEYPASTDIEAYLMYEDIDESKQSELMIKAMAETDPLTGVLNRTTFASRVRKLASDLKPDARHALVMLDIDGFKLLNDSMGHAAGDQALIDITNVLRGILRPGDLLGRLGGDEFIVWLADIEDSDIVRKLDQVRADSRKAFSLDVQVSASMGVAICPKDGDDFDTLYSKADSALYHVKDTGKDGYAFYSPEIEDEDSGAKAASADGRLAIKRRRMLIVDDNRLNREMLAHMFKDEFLVATANDGNAALIRMRHYGSDISIVLLDLMMPGMDGFAVLNRMRASAEMRGIPVVVVSGANEREASLRAIRGGASDFVTKPVDPDVIRMRVHAAITKAENERLRAQNSYQALQSDEIAKYRVALESTGTVVVEQNWISGAFTYDESISKYIAGNYDRRALWHILLSDMVADVMDVKSMQELIHDIANDRAKTNGEMRVMLKTPSRAKHWFVMRVYKQMNEFRLTDKLILTFNDVDDGAPRDKGRIPGGK